MKTEINRKMRIKKINNKKYLVQEIGGYLIYRELDMEWSWEGIGYYDICSLIWITLQVLFDSISEKQKFLNS